jgi:hypothetical protein
VERDKSWQRKKKKAPVEKQKHDAEQLQSLSVVSLNEAASGSSVVVDAVAVVVVAAAVKDRNDFRRHDAHYERVRSCSGCCLVGR